MHEHHRSAPQCADHCRPGRPVSSQPVAGAGTSRTLVGTDPRSPFDRDGKGGRSPSDRKSRPRRSAKAARGEGTWRDPRQERTQQATTCCRCQDDPGHAKPFATGMVGGHPVLSRPEDAGRMPMTTTTIKRPDAAAWDSQVMSENGKAWRQGVRSLRAAAKIGGLRQPTDVSGTRLRLADSVPILCGTALKMASLVPLRAVSAPDWPRAERESRLGAAQAGISPSGAAGELT